MTNQVDNKSLPSDVHIPPPWYKGGGGGWWNYPPRELLQYFETIFPSLEGLWSSLQDEVHFVAMLGVKNGLTTSYLWRNHSNWPLLNLTQNVREGWTNRYWKHQVPMFYRLGENSQNTLGAGGGTHPYPLVRPRVNTINWRDTTHFEDDYRIGCENAIHCQPQQSYSGLRSPQRSRP